MITWYGVEEEHEPLIAAAFPDATLVREPYREPRDTEVLVLRYRDTAPVTREALEAMPSLKLIVTMSVGTDHIDTAACAARGVTVRNTVDYCTESVAAHAFALLTRLSPALAGKRLGVIGSGLIGRALIRRALAAGMTAVAHDLVRDAEAARSLGFSYVPFDEALASDAVSLHVPATPKTVGLIGAEQLALLPDGGVLLNTARGALVDTPALLAELESGRLKAGLDVLAVDGAEEAWESAAARRLAALPNAILTRHEGGNTPEARRKAVEEAISIIKTR